MPKQNVLSMSPQLNKIDFVDISSPDYDPAQNYNISYEEVRSLLAVLMLSLSTA